MSLEYLRCIVLSAVLPVATFALPPSGVTPEQFNADSPMETQAAILARHDSWDANSLGNHRVVIDVSRATGAVAVQNN